MSISLKEVIEGAGYDLYDYDDLQRVKQLLLEADDLCEEVDNRIYDMENTNPDEEEAIAKAEYEADRLWREQHEEC